MARGNRSAQGIDAALYQRLVQSVVDYAIFMLDDEGYVSSWNPGAERIKGYTPDEILGEHFSRFYTPEDLERGIPKKALETARREGRFTAEACVRTGADSGPASSSIRSLSAVKLSGSPKSPAT